MTLQRLVLDFRTWELVVRCFYRMKAEENYRAMLTLAAIKIWL